MIGRIIEDKYRIDEVIGEGGFAMVYKGFDLLLKRPLAIKVMKQHGSDSAFSQRFTQECESMARMDHPGIVTVYSYGKVDDQPCLIMQLVEGCSLHEWTRNKILLPSDAVPLSLQICDAMEYAHSLDFLHRDLTLKNIMLEQKKSVGESVQGPGKIKILDFGLAKLMSNPSVTVTNVLTGTPHFMAPEQIEIGVQNGRLDVFAFGVGLFKMTIGRFPFVGEHATAVMYQTVNGPPPSFPDDYPASLKTIVQRCLERDPADRYANFVEVAEALGGWKDQKNPGSAKKTDPATVVNFQDPRRAGNANPYLNRVMVRNQREFFGRQREVRRIYARIDASHPQSISIVGERRIGKSSLLNYVHSKSNRRRHMTTVGEAICVYLDFQGKVDFDVPKFIDYLFNAMAVETGDKMRFRDSERTLDEFKNVIEKIHADGQRMIIMMDEFECITGNDNFTASFFSFLRSLANNYHLAFVTSSVEELQFMCHNADISDSPFFNIFSNLPLRPFKEEEARELIAKPSQACGSPLEPYADQILALAGRFPIFLQMACSWVIEQLLEGNEEIDWNEVSEAFRDEVHPHYVFIWDRMEKAARETLIRVTTDKPVRREHGYVAEELQRRGYLLASEDGLRLFSSSFASYVKSHALAAEEDRSWYKSLTAKFRRN